MAGARCTACGQANPDGAKFCNECAAPLARAAGHEVRKTLTVLFADLVGFTSLSERLDQESLRRVMDCFYEEMRGAVHAHGGTVAKFIGDAVMAVWGTPFVREDDALRAVRAAEEMRGALAALNLDLDHRWGVRVGMRTGVNTGEVVVDPTKPADLLVGDTLNVAARLEQGAADGEVLVGPETYRLVRDAATLKPVAPLQLKGKARPLAAYRLVDGHRAPVRREESLRAPLVGREAELDRLRAAFDEAVGARETRLVTVVGSPGVGKSRLAREFAARLGGEARVLRGHCEPVTEGATFLPVAEVLAAAAGVEAVPDGDGRVREAVGALLGGGSPVSAEETFWAVRRFLEGLARDGPVVVVFDDIHWGEPRFLDLIEHLVEWGRDGAVLLVALARPELRDARPGLAEGGLALEPLAPEASRALVDGLLGAAELPPALAARVLDTAEGNPLFLGEMLRMLVDDGVLRREGGVWVVADSEAVSVPPTIHALLAARLERLPAAERTVAERAAVVGPHFSRAAVAELSGEPLADTIDAHLDALRRKELIVAAHGSGDDPWFRFGHALIRDAAYRPLLKEARAELHERFATWLETRGDEADEIIGFHLERGYQYRRELGPLDDAGRAIGQRAGERLGAAGARALAREDLPAATNLLTRALGVLEEGDAVRAAVLLDLAETVLSGGDTARGEHVVKELGLRADAAGDERLRAYATVFGGQLANLVGAGGVRETIAALAEAASALEAAGDASGVAKAQHVIAAAHALLGEVAAAEAALDRALIAARTAGDARRVTAVLSGAPRAALWGPSPVVRASGRCLDVVRIVRMTPGNRHVETTALRCQAVLEAMRGRADAARTILRDGRAVLEELGLTLELHELDTHAGIVELLAGDPAAAEERLRAARDGFTSLGVDVGAAQAAALLARAALQQGRNDDAFALTEFAERRGGEDLKTAIAWRGVRAEALARRGEHDEARRLARDAVAMAEPTDALADKADALMALVEVLHACGDAGEARDAAAGARELYAAKEHEVGVARASAALGAPASRATTAAVAGAVALGDSPPERVFARALELLNAGRWDDFRDLHAPDLRVVDHQPEAVHLDRDGLVAALRVWEEMVPDYRWEASELLATSETDIAWVLQVRSDLSSGGGPVAQRVGMIGVTRNGTVVALELFDPDDDAAILARFDELQPQATASEIGRLLAEWVRLVNVHDWDGVRRLYAASFQLVDHRPQGADSDLDELIAAFRDMAELAPDGRWAFSRMLASSYAVAAAVVEFRGHASSGGGPLAQSYAIVCVSRDGRQTRVETFDPGDDEAIFARYEELRIEQEGTSAERVMSALVRAYNARDWDAVTDLYTEDCEHVDHRSVSTWGHMRSREDLIAEMRRGVDMTADVRMRSDTIATDGHTLILARQTWSGTHEGISFQIVTAELARLRDGRIAHVETLDADGEAAMLARFEELRIEREGCEVERALAAYVSAYNTRDWDALAPLFPESCRHIDHRSLRTWAHIATGPDAVDELRRGTEVTADMRVRVDMIETDHDTLAACRQTWSGTFAGSPSEIPAGYVVRSRDGRFSSIEVFDPEDDEALLARFQELRAERPGTAAERVVAAYLRAFNERDWDALAALFPDDCEHIDHRALATWRDLAPGPSTARALRDLTDVAPDVRSRIDVLMTDGDALAAIRQTWTGTFTESPMNISVGQVVAVRDERIVTLDTFDPEDQSALFARFEELRTGRAESPVERVVSEFVRAFNERDWKALADVYVDDLEHVDRRAISTWGDLRSRDDYVAALRRATEVTADKHAGYEVIATDGDLGAFRAALTGTFEGSPMGVVWGALVQERDGRIVRLEEFDPDDEAALLARFEEIRIEREGSPVERAGLAFVRAFNARNWEALANVYTEDCEHVDRRSLTTWGDMQSRGDILITLRQAADLAPDIRVRTEIIATDDESLVAYRQIFNASTDGSPLELAIVDVARLRNGRVCHIEAHDPDDEAAALARFEELRAETDSVRLAPGVDPDHAMVALAWQIAELFDARDWSAYRELYAPGFVAIDRRRLGWGEELDLDWLMQTNMTTVELYPDYRQRSEVVAAADDLFARVMEFHGHTTEGGGSVEMSFGVLAICEDGRIVRDEFFDAEDRAGMLARFEELRSQAAAAPAERLRSEWLRRFRARDWPGLRELYADDFTHLDRRRPALWDIDGPNDLVGQLRHAVDEGVLVHDRGETIAVDNELIALRETLSLEAGDGRTEVVVGSVIDSCDGRITRSEIFEPDDEAAILARFEELRAERENLAVIAHRRGDYASDAVVVDHRPPDATPAPNGLLLLATRGLRLALFSDESTRMLIQSDADGRIWRTDLYVAEDDAVAREALRLLGDLDAQDNAILAGFKAGDYESYRATLADDFFHEYNPAGQRFVGRDAMIDYLHKTFRLGAEDNGEVDRHATVAPGVATRRCRWFGRNHRTGADWEVIVYDVFTFDAGLRHTRLETFLPGDPRFDEAVARLAGAAARR